MTPAVAKNAIDGINAFLFSGSKGKRDKNAAPTISGKIIMPFKKEGKKVSSRKNINKLKRSERIPGKINPLCFLKIRAAMMSAMEQTSRRVGSGFSM